MISKEHKKLLESTHPITANVVIVDKDNEDEKYECKAEYYGTGHLVVTYKGKQLGIDPDNFHSKDPKRLYIVRSGEWSRFRVRSIILDSKAIRKNW
jgi:hypothetical protein